MHQVTRTKLHAPSYIQSVILPHKRVSSEIWFAKNCRTYDHTIINHRITPIVHTTVHSRNMHMHKNTIKSMSIVLHKYTCCCCLVRNKNLWPKNGLRSNLLASDLMKFFGGSMAPETTHYVDSGHITLN